jgi:O-6-methylguanine DNA methyltransferase
LARPSGLLPLLRHAQTQLREFLSGKRRAMVCPVDLSAGSPFQRRVWRATVAIPYGRARSYKWVAARVGGPQYARAVGLALGANPVPILVPCHRVVAHDGALGGFSCGLAMKRRLLALEGTLKQLRKGRGKSQ